MATLVAVEGSSYRRTGARLMVDDGGEYVGSISGGCLEAEIARKARWLVRDGACVQRYSTAFDDTAEIPYGLGCGGTVHVLIEPAGTPEFNDFMKALERAMAGEYFEVCTVLPGKDRPFSRAIHSQSGEQMCGGPGTYSERIDPPQRVLVFGAGNDAQPLVSMASQLGWRVIVIDTRVQWARQERFPEAAQVLLHDADVDLPFALQRDDFAVVMTHNFQQDLDWLQLLLPANLNYLGLLGARHRSARLAGEVAGLLSWPLSEVCDRLRAPVGLDLGGDGAEAIALSIVAEMQGCAAGRPSLSRRMTTQAVAEQIASADPTDYLQAHCVM